jgi:hypothetical protein
MVDISAIAGALTSLKAASEMTKAMIGLRDAETFRNKAIELQSVVLEAQAGAAAAYATQSELANRIGELERKIMQFENWDAEKKRYELKAVYKGYLAYALKPEMAAGEPAHYLCPSCYQKGQKSILQEGYGSLGENRLACPDCKVHIVTGYEPIGI